MMIHGDSHRLRRITRSTSEMKYKRFVLGWVWRQLTPIEDAEVENKNKLGRRRKAARVTYHRTHTAIISVASAVLTDGIDNANNASDVLDEKMKMISDLVDVENRKRAYFVHNLNTGEYSMCDRIELLQVRQHTGIIVNDQSPC